MSKHTPGPWETLPDCPGDIRSVARGDIAVCVYRGMKGIIVEGTEMDLATISREEAEANAQLMAASPDMFELLEKWSGDGCLQTFEDRQRFRAEVHALIEKLA